MSKEPKIDDGGPAEDMTVRDWFAGMALQGIIAHPGMEPDDCHKTGTSDLAYDFADAMLEARKQ